MANKRVAGICYVKADGEQFDVSGGLEVPLIDVKREAVMSVTGPAGYKETAVEPFIKLSAVVGASFPIETLQSATDMTVTAELPNGMVYTLSGAYIKGEPALKADDGTVDLEFGGIRGQWQ
ncbi:MAG: phage tail protein [Proteobacteria bacterium]|nr:phage tail protein [Pseudomonadota bacterium]